MSTSIYYTVYQITNNINKMIYIGVHKTINPQDDYMGSGYHIKRAIKKYGIENFTKEILYVYENELDAYQKEAEIVNEEFVYRKDTYNICIGGGLPPDCTGRIRIHKNDIGKNILKKDLDKYLIDGWELGLPPSHAEKCRNLSEETKKKIGLKSKGRKHSEETKQRISEIQIGRKMTPEAKENHLMAMHNMCYEKKIAGIKKRTENGYKHSEETIKKISYSNKGKKHSEESKQKISDYVRDTMFINNGEISKRIKIVDFPLYEMDGWVRGRKCKFR